jgi:hypothetical protein
MLDGSESRKAISLEKLPRTGAKPAKAKATEKPLVPAPRKKSTLGGGEIVNPWDG